MTCQRFTINVTSCAHFVRETAIGIFVVLLFHGRELVRDFGGEDRTKSLRIFNKPSAINEFCLTFQLSFELG